jgi:hypothetical protein
MPQLLAVVVGAQPVIQGALKDLVQADLEFQGKALLAEILTAKVAVVVVALDKQVNQVVLEKAAMVEHTLYQAALKHTQAVVAVASQVKALAALVVVASATIQVAHKIMLHIMAEAEAVVGIMATQAVALASRVLLLFHTQLMHKFNR